MSDSTDGQLVRLARSGDAEAYSALVARYQGHVYALAYSLAGNWADAQDIAQETFVRAYVNLGQLRDPERFAAWLRRVTFSVTMKWLRAFRPKVHQQLEGRVDLEALEIPDFAPGPPEVVERRELAEAVRRAIATLPAKYRLPLTMFHLDGLSYQKVADFLDIPLGTVQSLIHRARAKLKAALGAYFGEELQEVFNEHKLPADFAGRVLENIPRLSWERGECAFAGAVVACTTFLKEPVAYDLVMGVSGAAFRLLWDPQWRPSNGDLAVMGEEPVRRTFQALGYGYELLSRDGPGADGQALRARIMSEIAKGRPVIAEGGMGPPVCWVVAGYDEEGSVLLGRSFFDSSAKYCRSPDWYDECRHLVLIGQRRRPLPERERLRRALPWAIALAGAGQIGARASGLAAYDAWAEALLREQDFPRGDLEVLTGRCNISHSIVLAGLWDARRAAAGFLRGVASVEPAATPHLLAAAERYEEEVRLLASAMKMAPSCVDPEERRLEMADRQLRRAFVELLLQAKDEDERALECLARAARQVAPERSEVRSGLRQRPG